MELITWVEMSEEQKVLYDTYLTDAKGDLRLKVEKDGIASHRMEVLEVILRLRQICADPRILNEEISGSKIDRLLEDIEGHKVLIYSQFTSFLRLVGKELQKREQTFLYLDGSTSIKERSILVKQFQEDPNHVGKVVITIP